VHPDNVWSLHGLYQCLLRAGKAAEASVLKYVGCVCAYRTLLHCRVLAQSKMNEHTLVHVPLFSIVLAGAVTTGIDWTWLWRAPRSPSAPPASALAWGSGREEERLRPLGLGFEGGLSPLRRRRRLDKRRGQGRCWIACSCIYFPGA
jgi:hypothetical protein